MERSVLIIAATGSQPPSRLPQLMTEPENPAKAEEPQPTGQQPATNPGMILAASVDQAINDPDVPMHYANSFAVAQGNSDIGLFLFRFNKPEAVVSMSFTLAKTLAEQLGEAIDDLEERTGRRIMTTSHVDKPNEHRG